MLGTKRSYPSSSGYSNKRRNFGPMAGAAAAAGAAFEGLRRGYNSLRKRKPPTVNAITELSRSKKKFKINNYKLSRVVAVIKNRRVERFQGLSNFDTNVGYYYVGNHQSGTDIRCPMIIYDLGSINQPVLLSNATVAHRLRWDGVASTANCIPDALVGTVPDASSTSNTWQVEFQDKSSNSSFDSATLDWVQVKANLYGQRKRTTKFAITFFTVAEDDLDPVHGPIGDTDRRAMLQYMERPYIYSNLQQDASLKKHGLRIIKEFVYNIDPMTSIDLNTSTGKIHEAVINIQINKKMEYIWTSTGNMIGHNQPDGQDFEEFGDAALEGLHKNPRGSKNVFMAIRAFSPIRTTDLENADDSPSLDIILRRGMTLPPHN